jgi:gluconokinase
MTIGVSASGKTTLGLALAAALRIEFLDCDDLHPAANVEKMRNGIPLDDADREPWIAAICARLREQYTHQTSCVLACSALKADYRARFRQAAPRLVFVYLKASRPLLISRFAERRGHFMPVSLLDSQLAALEEPRSGEPVIDIDAAMPPEDQVKAVLSKLRP